MVEKNRDWLPKSRQKLYATVTEQSVPFIDANLARFGMTDTSPQGKWYKGDFTTQGYDPFVTAYAAWMDPSTRTPAAITAMNDAEKVFIAYYRELYRLVRGIPTVTNTDLERMGFPKRPDGERHPSPVETKAPEFTLTPDTDHRVQIHYYPAGDLRKKGKPAGQHGVEIRWDFSETPLESTGELHNSVFDTASPYTLAFDGRDQGRFICIAMRWENTRGEKGPWSRIERFMVP